MTHEPESMTEQEALRLWQRAAELQAEAARRAEARAAGAEEGEAGTAVARRDQDGYALAHVRAAALEAGISEEFVDAALAELRADRAIAATGPPGRRRISNWVLRDPPSSVEARRVVRADPRTVLAAMEEVLPVEPYSLLLRDRLGDPANGGTLVFDIQGVGFTTSGQGFKAEAAFADLREVYATLHSLPGEPARTELVLRSPVAWARRINAVIVGGLSGLGGFLGLALGVAAGSALVSLGPAVAGVVAATGAAAGGALALSGFRRLHHYGLRRGAKALEGAAATVAARAEGGWGFLGPRTAPDLPPPPDRPAREDPPDPPDRPTAV